jgi:hypothetical protein
VAERGGTLRVGTWISPALAERRIRRLSERPIPLWLTYDPEEAYARVDIQEAARDGALSFVVFYDKETNSIEVEITTADGREGS